MSNLYKYFNCQSNEELYAKLKIADPSVQSLNDFIDFAKVSSLLPKNKAITSPNVLAEYFSHAQAPKQDEMAVIFINTKNRPIHISKMDPSYTVDVRRVLKEGIIANSTGAFLVAGSTINHWDTERTKELFEMANISVVDDCRYIDEQHALFSNRGQQLIFIDEEKQESIVSNYSYDSLDKLEYYPEFVSYYAAQETIGLNILDDIEEIKSNLKVGYQHHPREVSGVIIYDERDNVLAMRELFAGGLNSAIVDPKVVAREVLRTSGAHGFALYHNHPSGVSLPSPEDKSLTENMKGCSQVLDIELLDHFIVGKENVYSFAEREDDFTSLHEEYQNYATGKAKVEKKKISRKHIELDRC